MEESLKDLSIIDLISEKHIVLRKEVQERWSESHEEEISHTEGLLLAKINRGRISLAEVARQANISRQAMFKCAKRLEEKGYLKFVVDGNNKYTVHVNKFHPRKSTCNCPFADGRRVVCKHMIALYFTAEPHAATDFMKEVEKWEEEEELREQEHYEDLRQYVKSLSKTELQEQLLDALIQLEERRDYYW